MSQSRNAAAVVALSLLVVSGGCVGFLVGSEPKSFAADPAVVGGDAAAAAGYERTRGPTNRTRNRTFSVAGQSRQVRVTSYVTEYRKRVDAGPLGTTDAAALAVVSTPKVQVLGETFNPVGDMNETELAAFAQSRYDAISVGEKRGSTTVQALGTDVAVTAFDGRATVAGGISVDVVVHVAKVEHRDDFLVVFAVHPRLLAGEAGNVLEMVRALEHPAERSGRFIFDRERQKL